MATEKVKKAKVLRKSQIKKLEELAEVANNAISSLDSESITLFNVWYENIDSIKDDFFKGHNIIIGEVADNDDATFDTEDNVRKEFEKMFYTIKSFYARLPSTNSDPQTDSSSNVSLPKIQLPIFSGDTTSFPSFIDMFDALIENNTKLSEIEKFNYLLASLRGPALALVKTLPLTSNNYRIAYNTLNNRYKNTRLIAAAHWAAIENSPKQNGENPQDLRNVLDIFSENIAALKILKFPTDQWDFILVQMLLKRIDVSVATRFELFHNSSDSPTFKKLFDFLSQHCSALANLNVSRQTKPSQKRLEHQKASFSPRTSTSLLIQTNNNSIRDQNAVCVNCKLDHMLFRCPEFIKKSPNDRYQFAKNLHLCINCLSNTHSFKNCQSPITCHRCGLRHHTSLHFDKKVPSIVVTSDHAPNTSPFRSVNDNSSSQSTSQNSSTVASTHAGFASSDSRVLLSTARVEVLDSWGNYQPFRCLLDSGSMTSFITKKCLNRLGITSTNFSLKLNGLGSMNTLANNGGVTISIRSFRNPSSILNVDAVVLPKICEDLPSTSLSNNFSYLSNLNLADEQFHSPGNIDLLLGADVFSKILLNGHISGANGEPDAINTIFGYVLMGKIDSPHPSPVVSLFCSTTNFSSLEESVKRFWEIESVPEIQSISPEDEACEKHFLETFQRDETGRFLVHYPFRNPNPTFPGIRNLAFNRFISLENRLQKNPQIYDQYRAFMREYLDLNHMELVQEPSTSHNTFYIPHHCVIRPDSTTTKLRVVFNGSAKLPNQTSLNENLFTGQKLQRDIVTILLNFRLHSHVLTADIKMMYRQIYITPGQRDFQRILWRFSPQEPIKDYRLNTVTYGLSPSPFLAIRTLLQLAKDDGKEFPLATTALENDTFVDDIVSGSSSLETVLSLQNQLIQLLTRAGLELRKWSSSEVSVLNHLPPSHVAIDPLSFDSPNDSSHKVLGLQWNPSSDGFRFLLQPLDKPCTKRNLLSTVARTYDPVGFLTPLTFLLKHLIQRLWMCKLDWDQEPSSDIIRLWDRYLSELGSLSEINIPRRIAPSQFDSCEIHCFGDASEKGYCAVLYFVFTSSSGSLSTHFVCAKSKVAPLKKISLPKLELCAALLAARLVSYIRRVYFGKLTFNKICCWSDSTITLYWLKSPSYRWKTFVGNRVASIQAEVSPDSWFHVASENNPADYGSRGLLPNELVHCSAWWAGPSFLSSTDRFSTSEIDYFSEEALEEERTLTLTVLMSEPPYLDNLLSNHSSLTKCIRILCYILRFILQVCKKPCPSGWLTSLELNKALMLLVKHTQSIHFSHEISSIRHGKPLPKTFKKLTPFLDQEGILRVGGRLRHAPLPFNRKFPALLPKTSRLTELIIEYTHVKYLHAGIQTVQYLISQQFWILCFKRSVRHIISKCVRCFRTHPVAPQPPMGDLPAPRISRLKPFLHTGVDYAGPFTTVAHRMRGAKVFVKTYLCLFICFATKAIHVELASDLTSDAFLAALRRFIARRGHCQVIYSDGATNFRGAYRQLNSFLSDATSHEAILFKRIPSASPNFGGLWEAGIKSVKSHLVRVVGNQVLTYEQLETVVTQIEALLNSRPLTPFSSDPNDFSALTPGHFLTLEPLMAPPEPDLKFVPINRLSRWQLLTRMHQDFWTRWSKEYLNTLQQKTKWLNDSPDPITKGSLVIIKTENIPPLKWNLGRVIETFPGPDGHVRVATVKTANGNILKRPVTKLCPLPLESNTAP